MTKVSYIHGIPRDEWRDRAKQVPRRSFVDYSALTEGEMKLVLAYEQFRILSAFYPESTEARSNAALLRDTLFLGLHGPRSLHSPKNRLSGSSSDAVRTLIQASRSLTAPAAFVLDGRPSILSGIGDVIDFDNPGSVIDPTADWQTSSGGSALPPMPAYTQKDCGKRGGLFANKDRKEAYDLCVQQNNYVKLLNEKLEKSGHHIVYAFNPDPNNSPNVVAVKTVNHQMAIDTWHEVTGLSKENLRNWIRVGVMRGNAAVKIEPFQPERTIEVFRDGVLAKNQKGIGVEPITMIIAIVTALASAAAATAGLLDSLNARDSLRFKSTLSNMGSESFGMQEGDYSGVQSGNGAAAAGSGFDVQQLLLPAAIATGAYFLLNDEK